MNNWHFVLTSTLTLILCYSTLLSSQVIEGDWSVWTCHNNTVAARNRTVQNCIARNVTDPTTNSTTVNTTCSDLPARIDRSTDVVSMSSWTSWSPSTIPSCSNTGTVARSRSFVCMDPTGPVTCSSACSGVRTQNPNFNVTVCCEGLSWAMWSEWTPTTCSPTIMQQTRQRSRVSCTSPSGCEMNCPDETSTRQIGPTTWSSWGQWSPIQEQVCGEGLRIRERNCTNTTSTYCEICLLGSTQNGTECCVVRNIWTSWTTWSAPTTTCPKTRSRMRTCIANSSVTGSDPTCSGGCTLTTVDTGTEDVMSTECTGTTAPSTGGDNSFPIWAIAVISAVGVVAVISLFIAITFAGRKLARRQQYDIGGASSSVTTRTKVSGVDNPSFETAGWKSNDGGIPPVGSYTEASNTLKYVDSPLHDEL